VVDAAPGARDRRCARSLDLAFERVVIARDAPVHDRWADARAR